MGAAKRRPVVLLPRSQRLAKRLALIANNDVEKRTPVLYFRFPPNRSGPSCRGSGERFECTGAVPSAISWDLRSNRNAQVLNNESVCNVLKRQLF